MLDNPPGASVSKSAYTIPILIYVSLLRENSAQRIRNAELFGPMRNDTVVVAVQVHDRLQYLTQLVSSLAAATGIQEVLLVFSHAEVMDQKLKDELPHVARWYNTVVNQKLVKTVLDTVDLKISPIKCVEKGKSCLLLLFNVVELDVFVCIF